MHILIEEGNLMYCFNCGIDCADATYCMHCGAKLTDSIVIEKTFNCSNQKTIKPIMTLNLLSILLYIPYVILSIVIFFSADWYNPTDGIGYFLGLIWPFVFSLILFFLVLQIGKSSHNKFLINTHLVVSIILLGLLVLGGIFLLIMSYGLIVFPIASGILQIILGSKLKNSYIKTK